MTCAALFGMPKLLACCEYNIALSALAGTQADLRARCENDQVLVGSWTRIAKGFCRALQCATGASKRGESEPCSCDCCLRQRGDPLVPCSRSCTCSRLVHTSKAARSFVQSPKEFFRMAEGDSPTK